MTEPIVIHDGNFYDHVFKNGESGFLPRQSEIGSSMPIYCDNFQLIPENEWKSRVAAMESEKAFARYRYEFQNPVPKNQGQLSFCWAFSLAQGVEIARAAAGHPYVELAPESLGALTGWRNAGFYCDRALDYAVDNGICTRQFITPLSLAHNSYKAGWQEDAKNHAPIERYDLGKNMWAETVTALLSGFAVYVGYNWWSHAVILDQLIYQGDELCVSGPNSWGQNQRYVLKGSKKIPSEAFVIRTVTYSDK